DGAGRAEHDGEPIGTGCLVAALQLTDAALQVVGSVRKLVNGAYVDTRHAASPVSPGTQVGQHLASEITRLDEHREQVNVPIGRHHDTVDVAQPRQLVEVRVRAL